jgi:ABC-type phosphate transport system permease subunit
MGWIGVAIALSIALYASEFARDQGTRDSVVTTWVAGAVGALALIPSVLFAVSAYREMRRCWAPAVALAMPALLAANLILSGL